MANEIKALYADMTGLKQDIKVDWKEDSIPNWKIDWATEATVPAAPVNTLAPAVTGTGTVGQVLTAAAGTWTGEPTPVLTYQWMAGAVVIEGETAQTLTLTASESGTSVTVVETATNMMGETTATSNAIAVA